MQDKSPRKLQLSLEADCSLCPRDTSQENCAWMLLRFRESASWKLFFHHRINKLSIWDASAGKKGLLQPLWIKYNKCPFELDVALRHKCAKENAWADEKYRGAGGRRRVWAHPKSLISCPSDQSSGLHCCFHLIQVFSPVEGSHVCVPVCCLLFHLGHVSHACQSYWACSTERKRS